MFTRKFLISGLVYLCIGVGYVTRAQVQPNPLDLVKQYGEELPVINGSSLKQTTFYKSLTGNSLSVIGGSDNTAQVARLLAESLPGEFTKVGLSTYLKDIAKAQYLKEVDEVANFSATATLLNNQKQKLSSIWNERHKPMALFTSLGQAQEGTAFDGHLTLGNFIEVLGKSIEQPAAHVALVPTSREGLEGMKPLFSDLPEGGGLIIKTRPLRNHLLAQHFKGDFSLFRALLLRFDYIIFINQLPTN